MLSFEEGIGDDIQEAILSDFDLVIGFPPCSYQNGRVDKLFHLKINIQILT